MPKHGTSKIHTSRTDQGAEFFHCRQEKVMNHHCSRAQRWLPIAFIFMLFACGGGGDDRAVTGANNAVANANRSLPENVFAATLDGAQALPANGSNASGIGIVMVDPANLVMRASLTTTNINGTSATINIAPTGTTGPAAFPLIETPSDSGIWSGQTTLTAEQFSRLRNGNFYIDVRSLAFPEGEIRGQILTRLPASGATDAADAAGVTSIDTNGFNSGSLANGNATTTDPADRVGFADTTSQTFTVTRRMTFINVLTGSQQVPSNASRGVAIGVLIVNPFDRTMTATITSLGIAGLGAHIHRAAAGSTGATAFSLNETSAGSGIWGTRLGLSEAQLDAFDDGAFYFDIHSASYPEGELRGQIIGSGKTGDFRTGPASDGSSIPQPIVPGRDATGSGDASTLNTGAGVPSIGNPAGSGIGSGIDTGSTAGLPSLGNPAGASIGSAGNTGITDSAAFDSGTAGATLF